MVGRIGLLQTAFGECLHVGGQGDLIDDRGQHVGKLSLDNKIVRFEISQNDEQSSSKKVSGVIRGADVVVPTYTTASIPATIKIGELLDREGRPLTAAMLVSCLWNTYVNVAK